MPRQKAKGDWPQKICPVCDRPFTWRKKWATCWEEVKYCSDRCRRRRRVKRGDRVNLDLPYLQVIPRHPLE
ncbi:DUF2256 domain-containing protein [Spirulina sp. CCNP1310]|uniref:DUF2256 domain-containing protein n=1 Tax=Spirulina sp. CCNP1310 TaxID=3110249 RepID=UPI003A4C7DD4